MISRIWFINITLALFVAFLGFRAYGVWSQEQPNIQTSPKSRKAPKVVPRTDALMGKRQTPPEKDYIVLVNQNLFSPERKEVLPEEKKPAKKEEKLYAVEKKNLEEMLDKMVLYGLVITEDSAKALISDVSFKPVVRRGRKLQLKKLTIGETKWVKSGDMVGEFKVTKIEKDRIRLEVKGNKYDLLLYDKEKLKPHAPVNRKGSPTVVGAAIPKPEQAPTSLEKKPSLPKKKLPAPLQPQSSKKTPPANKDLKNPTRK
jgi:hypothetical protein